MIVDFTVTKIGPEEYLLVAIMFEQPPVQVGVFEDLEDIDEACDQFLAEHARHLH